MNDLTISPEGIDLETLLDDWSWNSSEAMRPVLITAMGDVFAQGASGAFHFVDAVEGKIREVADDTPAFEILLRDSQFVTDHMFPARIVELREAEKTLGAQQVYSHKLPLVLGGEDELENIETTDAAVHLSTLGQIHQQIKDLPDGTPISEITIGP